MKGKPSEWCLPGALDSLSRALGSVFRCRGSKYSGGGGKFNNFIRHPHVIYNWKARGHAFILGTSRFLPPNLPPSGGTFLNFLNTLHAIYDWTYFDHSFILCSIALPSFFIFHFLPSGGIFFYLGFYGHVPDPLD